MFNRMMLAGVSTLALAMSAQAGQWVIQGKTRIVGLEKLTSSRGTPTTYRGRVEYLVQWSDDRSQHQWRPMPAGKLVELHLMGWRLKAKDKYQGTVRTNSQGEVSLTRPIPRAAKPGWGKYQMKFLADQRVGGASVKACHAEQWLEITH